MYKYGDVIRTKPTAKHPNRWCRVLAVSPDGKRVWFALFPEGSERPKPLDARGQ
jgi:hypothetical protein